MARYPAWFNDMRFSLLKLSWLLRTYLPFYHVRTPRSYTICFQHDTSMEFILEGLIEYFEVPDEELIINHGLMKYNGHSSIIVVNFKYEREIMMQLKYTKQEFRDKCENIFQGRHLFAGIMTFRIVRSTRWK